MVYDGIINKPDIDEIIIEHYGVKGMKWRRRRKKKKASDEQIERHIQSHLLDDIRDKKSTVLNKNVIGRTHPLLAKAGKTGLKNPDGMAVNKYDHTARYEEEIEKRINKRKK